MSITAAIRNWSLRACFIGSCRSHPILSSYYHVNFDAARHTTATYPGQRRCMRCGLRLVALSEFHSNSIGRSFCVTRDDAQSLKRKHCREVSFHPFSSVVMYARNLLARKRRRHWTSGFLNIREGVHTRLCIELTSRLSTFGLPCNHHRNCQHKSHGRFMKSFNNFG